MNDFPRVSEGILGEQDTAKTNTELFLSIVGQYFPEAIKDGEVDFAALKEEMGEFAEVGSEHYDFTWAGKQAAKKEAQADLFGKSLRYKPEDSLNPDTTENVYIEGDNLEALKLLRRNYHGKIKLIYIDPPYNTGSDFVYHDDFSMTDEELAELSGDVVEGVRFQKNSKDSARYHTDWLNMMYPRLKLARELLTDDGVIFISIDDNEQGNLKKICDYVFGEKNFVGCLIIQTATDNNPRQITTEHEYILCYAKDKPELQYWQSESEKAKLIQSKYQDLKAIYGDDVETIQVELRKWIKKNEDSLKGVAHYDNVDHKGVFHDGDVANTVFGGYEYEVIHPVTGKPCKIPDKGFRFAEATMREMIANDDIMFGADETTLIKPKKRIENAKDLLRSVIYEDGRSSTKHFESLMARDIFQNPKSHTILERIISFIVKPNDIVLDFFSGSATTAESVMMLNVKKRDYKVKYIMVQYPENLDESMEKSTDKAKKTLKNAIAFVDSINKPHNICEIGKERIRRAVQELHKENPNAQFDDGFKVFEVGKTTIRWNLMDDDELTKLEKVSNDTEKLDFTDGHNDTDIVYEIMLRQYGIPLSTPIEKLADVGDRTYIFADAVVVCLEPEITDALIEKLADIEPTPAKFVLRDSAFGDNIEFKDFSFRKLSALIRSHQTEEERKSKYNNYTVEFI